MYQNMVLFAALLNFIMSSSAREQWIDPHDMTVKQNINPQIANKDLIFDSSQVNCIDNVDDTLHVHYKRTLSILLNTLQIDEANSQYRGVVTINMSAEDYIFLKNFVQNSIEDVTQFRKINTILDNVLSKSLFQRTSDSFTSWIEWFYFTFYHHTTGIAIVGLFISWASYRLIKLNWTTWRVVKTLVLFAWVIDFAFTWIHLIQEAEIEKVADSLKYGSIPAVCDPNKMNWWQYTLSFFTESSDCRKYHTTMLENVFWKISPFTVFAHQFGIVIATPANNIGKAIGSLVSGMLKPLPFGINYILLPILLLFFMVAACIILSFLTNTAFQINLLHLISLKIGDKQRHMIGNLLSIPVELQQEAIENVRGCEPTKQKRIKEKQLSSDVQSSADNIVRVEDVSIENDANLFNEDINSSSKHATITETVKEDKGNETEIRQKRCEKENIIES